MAGRIPKPKTQRQRTNKTMGEQLSRDGSGRNAPGLPGADDLSEFALDYWETIWASPMGAVFLDADVPALVRLTELVHHWHVAREPNILGEIRNLEDRFGLSPLARRRLEWEITQAGGQSEDTPISKDEDDRWLRAVE